MNIDELKNIVDFCKQHGITHYKNGDIELHIAPPVKELTEEDRKKKEKEWEDKTKKPIHPYKKCLTGE